MTEKKTYWIVDQSGVHALVEGVEERDLWTQVRGWADATEPSGDTQVRVINGDLLGCIPFGALEGGWAGTGWEPGPPPAPVDVYRDPVPAPVREQEPEPDIAEPTPKTKAATGDQSKEK